MSFFAGNEINKGHNYSWSETKLIDTVFVVSLASKTFIGHNIIGRAMQWF